MPSGSRWATPGLTVADAIRRSCRVCAGHAPRDGRQPPASEVGPGDHLPGLCGTLHLCVMIPHEFILSAEPDEGAGLAPLPRQRGSSRRRRAMLRRMSSHALTAHSARPPPARTRKNSPKPAAMVTDFSSRLSWLCTSTACQMGWVRSSAFPVSHHLWGLSVPAALSARTVCGISTTAHNRSFSVDRPRRRDRRVTLSPETLRPRPGSIETASHRFWTGRIG